MRGWPLQCRDPCSCPPVLCDRRRRSSFARESDADRIRSAFSPTGHDHPRRLDNHCPEQAEERRLLESVPCCPASDRLDGPKQDQNARRVRNSPVPSASPPLWTGGGFWPSGCTLNVRASVVGHPEPVPERGAVRPHPHTSHVRRAQALSRPG
jgi:hypothetical protein